MAHNDDAPQNAWVLKFHPPHHMSFGEAWAIVKNGLDDLSTSVPQKTKAIETIARAETLNSVTKAELQKALRFLFDYYEF